MVAFWHRCTTHLSLFSGDWDVCSLGVRVFDPWRNVTDSKSDQLQPGPGHEPRPRHEPQVVTMRRPFGSATGPDLQIQVSPHPRVNTSQRLPDMIFVIMLRAVRSWNFGLPAYPLQSNLTSATKAFGFRLKLFIARERSRCAMGNAESGPIVRNADKRRVVA